ncbi:hypothetical protein [Virgibacillus alimentarius]|uniref:Plasmid segregation centromere-binding protein ParR n=1 Tax=Virgibacillus alimentarius TaxID=698769 RepID=A0ABS4SCE4_9BACI|nr:MULTISPECIES: hypothetical protein [Virgibacillus]MBP2259178.1 hypothetical protein [Virgibacillus alimentarius]HLR66899.1 hypothetical protein [Virgibacillus sp.]
MRESRKSIERGQSITFRVPSDTPDYLLKQLQRLKDTARRNFSSEIAQFVLKGVNETYAKQKETITIPLPKQLTKEQKNWLKHEHSEALIGSILYQLINDPIRATSLLASLNSNAVDIDEALYLQEEVSATKEEPLAEPEVKNETNQPQINDDDLLDVDLSHLQEDIHDQTMVDGEVEEEEDDDPLSDFFSSMNK